MDSQNQSLIKPSGPPAKPKARSPTRPQTPPILRRQKSRERKKKEEEQAQAENEKALAIVQSRGYDYTRLQELCEPRKVKKNPENEPKPVEKKILSEADLQKQHDAIQRLSQGNARNVSKKHEDKVAENLKSEQKSNEQKKNVIKKLKQ